MRNYSNLKVEVTYRVEHPWGNIKNVLVGANPSYWVLLIKKC